jgi:CheY-like chemotaxis protein
MGGRLESGQSPYGGARLVAVIPLHVAGSGGEHIDAPELEPASVSLDPEFAGRRPLRILAIDDTLAAREFMQAALSALGYIPALAASAEDALALARAGEYDLIFVDLQLPGMDGFAAAAQLRSLLGVRPFLVALSANALANDAERLNAAGFEGFVRKPLSLRALPALLERAYERSQHAAAGSSAGATALEEPPETIFDADRWLELRSIPTGSGQTLLDKMSARVLADLPELHRRCKEARSSADGAELTRALHDIAGVMFLIGARRAAERARECELAAKRGDLSGSPWAELEAELRRVQRGLLERPR